MHSTYIRDYDDDVDDELVERKGSALLCSARQGKAKRGAFRRSSFLMRLDIPTRIKH